MFATPLDQIVRLFWINKHLWRDSRINSNTIAALGVPPSCPVSDENGLYCRTLLFETGDPVETFRRNWEALVAINGKRNSWLWHELQFTSECLWVRDGAMPRKPGLRWQVAELGRRFSGSITRNIQWDKFGLMAMGQELPLIAALHHDWVMATGGREFPLVQAADLQAASDLKHPASPYLGHVRKFGGRILLSTCSTGSPKARYGAGFLLV